MKFGQFTEYNMRKNFLKKSKLSLSLDQYPKVLYSFFLLYAKLRVIEIY